MFITRARFKKTSIYCTFILVGASTHAQSLEWPNTFTGQPDFEFTRGDIVKEIQEKRPESFSVLTGNLDRSLNTQGVNPFEPKTSQNLIDIYSRYNENESVAITREKNPVPQSYVGTRQRIFLRTGETAGANIVLKDGEVAAMLSNGKVLPVELAPNNTIVEYVASTQISKEEIINKKFQDLFAGEGLFSDTQINLQDIDNRLAGLQTYQVKGQLPDFYKDAKGRLSPAEFKRFLERLLRQTLQKEQDQLNMQDFTQDIKKIKIDSIVTSPFKYAVLDGEKYSEKERFFLSVQRPQGQNTNFRAIVEQYLPPKDSMDKGMYQSFVNEASNVIEQYEAELGIKSGAATRMATHKIGVTVKEIGHRKVILTIGDKDYPIKINLAL